jgi:predicted metal-dependent phosphoesterase TrpH
MRGGKIPLATASSLTRSPVSSPPLPPAFDLQSHSVHSDGVHQASEVVAYAAEAGVELLALSDHDTVDGVQEALDAGARHGVAVVRATEISAVEGPHEDLHVLGYGVDHTDATLAERLLDAREDRVRRADRMAERLQELGYEVDPAPLEARRAAGKPIGRPHLSAAVLQHPANAERLAEEGHGDVSSFIPAYLIQGKPGYVARTHPTVGDAIAWIHEAGGVAIWAHPFWDIDDAAEVLDAVDRFVEQGLDGVEVFYPTHDAGQTRLLAERCEERGLLTTGSSDFHGVGHRLFSEFLAYDLHGLEPRLGPIAGE